MNILTLIMLFFAVLAAIDRIFGNRFGLGKEFEKAFLLFGTLALSMMGMIIISPFIAKVLSPVSGFLWSVFHIDPSIIPASVFANDMGGAAVACEMAKNEVVGLFNAMVVSAMMGCTVSFTIPLSLSVVKKEQHNQLLLGLLCGIVTIPLGCFASGLICRIPVFVLILNLLPLILFSAVVSVGLWFKPDVCVKIFKAFGVVINIIITLGLVLGIITFMSGYELIGGLVSLEEAADICLNIVIFLSGAFPLIYIISKVMAKPFGKIGKKAGINEASVTGLISSLASSTPTFGMMDKMDKKGAVINSAFAVSAAFVLGDHLAFTFAFNSNYIIPMMAGKIVAGFLAVALAVFVYNKNTKKEI